MKIPNLKQKIILKSLVACMITLIVLLTSSANDYDSGTSKVIAQSNSTCLNRVNIPQGDLHWLYAPESPDELYTEEPLYYLAGQLIINDIVDPGDCPGGGLMTNGYASACGMAAAYQTVIEIQNLVNEPILLAFEEVGVPPVLLKQVIRYESQFWPSQDTIYHYGYGHLTHIGILNAIQWNRDLFNKVCLSGDYLACTTSYSTANQILTSLIATCDTCEYGIDTDTAKRSVDILAESLLGYCFQTEQIILNATGWDASLAIDYATIWKLTLMNYNAGSVCTYNTVESTFKVTQGPMDWGNISANVSINCVRGLYYANQITERAFDFPPSE